MSSFYSPWIIIKCLESILHEEARYNYADCPFTQLQNSWSSAADPTSSVMAGYNSAFRVARDPPPTHVFCVLRCLAERVYVSGAAWTGVDDGRKIAGEIKGVATVIEAEVKGKFQSRFGLANQCPITPSLTIKNDTGLRRNGIDKGFAVACEIDAKGYNVRD